MNKIHKAIRIVAVVLSVILIADGIYNFMIAIGPDVYDDIKGKSRHYERRN